jgi:hypothetical protein
MNLDKAQRIIADVDPVNSLLYFEGPRQTTLLDQKFTPEFYGLYDLKFRKYNGRVYNQKTGEDLTGKEGKFTLYFNGRELGGPYSSKQLRGVDCAQKNYLELLSKMEIKERLTNLIKNSGEGPVEYINLSVPPDLHRKFQDIADKCFGSE